MQGAFGKTSGRSFFPNAPLRATSSALSRSMSHANRKTLRTCTQRTPQRVGFARTPETFTFVCKLGCGNLFSSCNAASRPQSASTRNPCKSLDWTDNKAFRLAETNPFPL